MLSLHFSCTHFPVVRLNRSDEHVEIGKYLVNADWQVTTFCMIEKFYRKQSKSENTEMCASVTLKGEKTSVSN